MMLKKFYTLSFVTWLQFKLHVTDIFNVNYPMTKQ